VSAQAIGITTAPAKIDLEVAEPNFCRPSTSTHCDCAPTVAPLRSETNSRRLIVPSRQDNDHRTDKSPYLGRDDPEAQGPLWVQAVWKRFSSPKNCTQPGAMDLDATV